MNNHTPATDRDAIKRAVSDLTEIIKSIGAPMLVIVGVPDTTSVVVTTGGMENAIVRQMMRESFEHVVEACEHRLDPDKTGFRKLAHTALKTNVSAN